MQKPHPHLSPSRALSPRPTSLPSTRSALSPHDKLSASSILRPLSTSLYFSRSSDILHLASRISHLAWTHTTDTRQATGQPATNLPLSLCLHLISGVSSASESTTHGRHARRKTRRPPKRRSSPWTTGASHTPWVDSSETVLVLRVVLVLGT